MSDEDSKSEYIKESFNILKDKVIVLYMSNGNRILGEIYNIISAGIIMKNPVIINFNVNNSAIYMEDLYGGVAQNNVSLFPSSSIINFNLVIPYVANSYRKYIEDLAITKSTFLSEHTLSTINITIH